MSSAIYNGWVSHHRLSGKGHRFRYRVFMPYLDLDTLPELLRKSWGWSASRPALGWFRRADFHGDPARSLKGAVLDTVFEATGVRPAGPVYMLGNLRYFGFIINPICCYYCFSADGEQLEYIVADVTNTPWNERHSYVLTADGNGEWFETSFEKEMHVSPFYPMDMLYKWRSNTPADKLMISLVNMRAGVREFEASLSMRRREATPASLRRALLAYPFMTAKVGLAIYWQALRLWLGGVQFHSNPGPLKGTPDASLTEVPIGTDADSNLSKHTDNNSDTDFNSSENKS